MQNSFVFPFCEVNLCSVLSCDKLGCASENRLKNTQGKGITWETQA